MLYNNLSAYLKNKYGKSIGKICIDGGFSCPNRDGKCGTGGCICCGERGAGEHMNKTLDIPEQVRRGLLRSYDGYIAYFQNFTNTYAPIRVLKERYDSALISDKIVALSVGTRPDCIDEDVARLIESYKDRVDVQVELGLQSAKDETAVLINRGYMLDSYLRAAEILNKRNIPFVTHMIIGLPGENERDVEHSTDVICDTGAEGIKIHSLYVMEGTALADMYRHGEYTPIERDEYVRLAARSIARLRPDVVVHRITGDCPKNMLLAPSWNLDKHGVINDIRKYLSDNNLRQGTLYKR